MHKSNRFYRINVIYSALILKTIYMICTTRLLLIYLRKHYIIFNMDAFLRNLMIELIQQRTIALSWGINTILIEMDNISFKVNAFKYKGRIKIKYINNNYIIILEDKDVKVEDIALKEIVCTIDHLIEVTEDYPKTLKQWIKKTLDSI